MVDVCVGQADCNDYRLCADTDGCDSVYVHALGAVRPHPVRDKYSHERCTAGVYRVESDEICAGQCFSVCGQKPACRRPSYQPRGRSLCHCAGYRLLHADAVAADRGAYGKEYAGTDPHIPEQFPHCAGCRRCGAAAVVPGAALEVPGAAAALL